MKKYLFLFNTNLEDRLHKQHFNKLLKAYSRVAIKLKFSHYISSLANPRPYQHFKVIKNQFCEFNIKVRCFVCLFMSYNRETVVLCEDS